MYSTFLSIDSTLYDKLYFDKIENLNTYGLKTVIPGDLRDEHGYDINKTGYARCNGFDLELLCTILKHINASMTVKLSSDTGFIDEKGEPHGARKDVLLENVEIDMQTAFLRDFCKMQTYPFHLDTLKIISLKDSSKNFSKFLYLFDEKVLAILIIICLVFTIF